MTTERGTTQTPLHHAERGTTRVPQTTGERGTTRTPSTLWITPCEAPRKGYQDPLEKGYHPGTPTRNKPSPVDKLVCGTGSTSTSRARTTAPRRCHFEPLPAVSLHPPQNGAA